jgi:hypothetical protein
MHHQIKEVCNKLKIVPFTPKVIMDLTAGERTPLGTIVSHLFYKTDITDLLNRDDYSGYPHNGGSHTFRFNGTWQEDLVLLELLSEDVLNKYKDPEVREVALQLMYVSQEILSRRKQ